VETNIVQVAANRAGGPANWEGSPFQIGTNYVAHPPNAFVVHPTIFWGLSYVQCDQRPLNFSSSISDATVSGFSIHASAPATGGITFIGFSYYVCPVEEAVAGSVSFGNLSNTASNVQHVTLPSGRFSAPPRVAVAIAGLDVDSAHEYTYKIVVQNVTAAGFDIVCSTWNDTVLRRLNANYLAVDSNLSVVADNVWVGANLNPSVQFSDGLPAASMTQGFITGMAYNPKACTTFKISAEILAVTPVNATVRFASSGPTSGSVCILAASSTKDAQRGGQPTVFTDDQLSMLERCYTFLQMMSLPSVYSSAVATASNYLSQTGCGSAISLALSSISSAALVAPSANSYASYPQVFAAAQQLASVVAASAYQSISTLDALCAGLYCGNQVQIKRDGATVYKSTKSGIHLILVDPVTYRTGQCDVFSIPSVPESDRLVAALRRLPPKSMVIVAAVGCVGASASADAQTAMRDVLRCAQFPSLTSGRQSWMCMSSAQDALLSESLSDSNAATLRITMTPPLLTSLQSFVENIAAVNSRLQTLLSSSDFRLLLCRARCLLESAISAGRREFADDLEAVRFGTQAIPGVQANISRLEALIPQLDTSIAALDSDVAKRLAVRKQILPSLQASLDKSFQASLSVEVQEAARALQQLETLLSEQQSSLGSVTAVVRSGMATIAGVAPPGSTAAEQRKAQATTEYQRLFAENAAALASAATCAATNAAAAVSIHSALSQPQGIIIHEFTI
jgi:hypothetical protein